MTESVELAGLPCRPCHQRTCEPGDFRCLAQLPADVVAEAAERALLEARQDAASAGGQGAAPGSGGRASTARPGGRE